MKQVKPPFSLSTRNRFISPKLPGTVLSLPLGEFSVFYAKWHLYKIIIVCHTGVPGRPCMAQDSWPPRGKGHHNVLAQLKSIWHLPQFLNWEALQ